MKKNKLVHWFIISTFVSLYLIVSIISTIHVIQFFKLSNPMWLAVSLALAFEVGAAASLSSIIVMEKMNKFLVWTLFIVLTVMQAMGNTYYAYTHLNDFQGWVELFGLVDEELLYQKRVLSIISGAILPLVSLGFIKSLVDYIKPSEETIKDMMETPEKKEEIQNIDLGTSGSEELTVQNELVEDAASEDVKSEEEIVTGSKKSFELTTEEADAILNEESQQEEATEEIKESQVIEAGYKMDDSEMTPVNSNNPVRLTDDPVLRYKMKIQKENNS
jgi:hypothetical protein